MPGPKILYLIDEMEALTAGGTERQLLQMIQLTAASGFEPELWVLSRTEWLTSEFAGCPVKHWKRKSFRPGLFLELVREMRRGHFEIVQTFFKSSNLLGPVAAWLAGVPVRLGSRRNLNYWMSPHFAHLQAISNRFATRLVANCDAVRQVVARMELTGVRKIDVIYNGIDAERFRPDPTRRNEMRERLGYNAGDIVIGNVSVLRHPKGVDTFVQAAAEVAKRIPQARFLLVGDGPLRAELEAMAASFGISERILFAGAQEEIVPWLNALDIAVLSSKSEGFSNSLLEYMSVGLASVATDVGGNREALTPGTGLIVPARDAQALAAAITELALDPAKRSTFGRVARERVEATYSLPAIQRELTSYYHSLLATARS